MKSVLKKLINHFRKKRSPNQFVKGVSTIFEEGITFTVHQASTGISDTELERSLKGKKEELIIRLLAFGYSYESYSIQEKEFVQQEIMKKISAIDSNLWSKYMEVYNTFKVSRSLISSFNTITQYAFFDLLRKQDPNEAKRIGI